MKNQQKVLCAIETYSDMVRRICFMHLKDYSDVEDVFQEVFIKYMLYDGTFESDAHEKAWLIRVSINACKDVLKSFFRKRLSLNEIQEPSYEYEYHGDVLQAVKRLTPKYRNVIYLFYYEGYTAIEIGAILKRNVSTIYTWLDRGRKELREQLGGERLEI